MTTAQTVNRSNSDICPAQPLLGEGWNPFGCKLPQLSQLSWPVNTNLSLFRNCVVRLVYRSWRCSFIYLEDPFKEIMSSQTASK